MRFMMVVLPLFSVALSVSLSQKIKACGSHNVLVKLPLAAGSALHAASLRDGDVLLLVCLSVHGGRCLSCQSCCRQLRQV